METKGIDVSVFQGDIDWQKVANSDINFAMIRSSYGINGIDEMFVKNMDGVKSTNINPGAYHYCYARNPQEAIDEANHFIDTIKLYKFSYPVALDLEEVSIGELGANIVADIINSFFDVLKNQKYYPILYTNLNWLKTFVNTSLIPDVEIWLAEWGPSLTFTNNVTMWQYSQDGEVAGINRAVDLNTSFKDYPTIIKNSGLNNNTSEPPAPQPTPTPQPTPSVTQYIVKRGDTLWGIAESLLGNGNIYREIMVLNGLTSDRIYPGQVLKIPQNTSETEILYTVKKGDTLWSIAERFLSDGNSYKLIMELNGLTTETIYPGQILRIPLNSEDLYIEYTVKPGDTLIGIATRLLGDGQRYNEIMQLNNLSNDLIYPGQILKIPSK